MILELCKGVHCVDLGESFPTHIYLQNLASIQPRTSLAKFAASRDKPGRNSPYIPVEADLPGGLVGGHVVADLPRPDHLFPLLLAQKSSSAQDAMKADGSEKSNLCFSAETKIAESCRRRIPTTPCAADLDRAVRADERLGGNRERVVVRGCHRAAIPRLRY